MVMPARLFMSCGNLAADRRYDYARDLAQSGDDVAAADLLLQAIELVPDFASAWFALGECYERLNQNDDAIAAYRRAAAADPADRHGASLRLMRLGAMPLAAMPDGYVRTLFDQYATRFDQSLVERLAYRGPHLLFAAVRAVCSASGRQMMFGRALDLGCGTGLAGRAFAAIVDKMTGVDLSPGMIAQAQAAGCYATLEVSEMVAALRARGEASFDLVLAADAAVYLSDLKPLLHEAARVMRPDGLIAFTVETHAGDGVILGAGLRYAHADAYVRETLTDAGLTHVHLDHASTRNEDQTPVPGLVVVASR